MMPRCLYRKKEVAAKYVIREWENIFLLDFLFSFLFLSLSSHPPALGKRVFMHFDVRLLFLNVSFCIPGKISQKKRKSSCRKKCKFLGRFSPFFADSFNFWEPPFFPLCITADWRKSNWVVRFRCTRLSSYLPVDQTISLLQADLIRSCRSCLVSRYRRDMSCRPLVVLSGGGMRLRKIERNWATASVTVGGPPMPAVAVLL